MNNLTSDWIAIDTNVFGHLINPKHNSDKHIYNLLKQLKDDNIFLLVDDKQLMRKEYNKRIRQYIKEAYERQDERYILLYFIDRQNHKEVPVSYANDLMSAILKVISEKKDPDRYFVYVAFNKDRVLITNDRKDMIDSDRKKGKKEGETRDKLRKIAKQYNFFKADIFDSKEAWKKLQ